ncbi:MAG: glycosyltransferase family 4 protein [Parcubacteria group bacterium]|jgi:glycosyltransferase involved in cell wall biosynthesis
MKIIIFCPYYSPHIGGLETHADEFNKYLSQRGIDITVFTPRLPKNAPENEIRYGNVKIMRFPAFEIISNYPLPKFWTKKYRDLKKEIKKEKYDIVISRTRFFNTSLLALIYSKTKKTKWIHIEHGSDFVELSSNLKTLLARFYDYTFGRLIFKNSDINISISRAVKKFVYKFDKRESPVIYRGLDLGEIDNIIPDIETKNKYEGKIIISFVGRLYKWKGVKNSIEAIKSLPEEIKKKIVFLIIGDGEDFSYLKKISENEKTIEMLGNLPREKAIAILKITDIYLHSAYPGGGLSTSLLEAMYCGCAVIATPNEGADEVIENDKNGILIETANSVDITKNLLKLINNINLKMFIPDNGKVSVKNKFNWMPSIETYNKIFNKLK